MSDAKKKARARLVINGAILEISEMILKVDSAIKFDHMSDEMKADLHLLLNDLTRKQGKLEAQLAALKSASPAAPPTDAELAAVRTLVEVVSRQNQAAIINEAFITSVTAVLK